MSCTSSLSSSSQSFSFCLQESIEKRMRLIQVDRLQSGICLQQYYMSVCLSVYLPARLCVSLYDYMSACLSVCLSAFLSASLSLFLSARLSIYFQLQPLGLRRKLARPASLAEQNARVGRLRVETGDHIARALLLLHSSNVSQSGHIIGLAPPRSVKTIVLCVLAKARVARANLELNSMLQHTTYTHTQKSPSATMRAHTHTNTRRIIQS